jgi:uncharacterized membrane protein
LRPIGITVLFDAPADRVWAELADLGSHPDWMRDAGTIEFVTDQTSGLGTEMRVPTRIGPFRTVDSMTVIEWVEGGVIAVEHVGAVSGVGRFEIEPDGPRTRMTWRESLRFPWWLGGPIGSWLARPILRSVWRGNLMRLGERLEVRRP